MTKVKLNQNTSTACSRIFSSSSEMRASRLPFPAAAEVAFGGSWREAGQEHGLRDPGEQHQVEQCQQLPD